MPCVSLRDPESVSEYPLPYAEIAAEYGTPTFVLDVDRLVANYHAFAVGLAELSAPTRVYYSVKTNYLPLVLGVLRGLGAGADVVSGYELKAALAAGFDPADIVFNGPMKTQEEIDLAVRLGVHVNIDGPADVRRLAIAAAHRRCTVDVGVRVHSSVPVYTSRDPSFADIATRQAQRSKFGWPVSGDDGERMIRMIEEAPGLRLVGVHCHLGSQITDEDQFTAALDQVCGFAARARAANPVTVLNIGGGFGTPGIRRVRRGPLYGDLQSPEAPIGTGRDDGFDLTTFVRLFDGVLTAHGLSDMTVFTEPGRIVVSDAVGLLSRVVSVKRNAAGTWVILDAGQHLLPTANPDEHRVIRVLDREGTGEPAMVGGPLCFDADVLAAAALLPSGTTEDDLVLIEDAGAYSVSRSTNFIRERAAVVVVREGRHELCWRRETYDDIFRFAVPTAIERELREEL